MTLFLNLKEVKFYINNKNTIIFQLLYMGRDYPAGYEFFRNKARTAFSKNKEVADPDEIKKLILKGRYVVKELEAMYKIKKYRAMKRRYYQD